MIVVDVNVLVYCWTPGPRSKEARAVSRKDSDWHFPALWRSEMLNVIVGYLRRGQLGFDQGLLLLRTLERRYRNAGHHPSLEDALKLARRSQCSVYDCEYAAVAYQFGVSLVTEDRALLEAFPDIAVSMAVFTAG